MWLFWVYEQDGLMLVIQSTQYSSACIHPNYLIKQQQQQQMPINHATIMQVDWGNRMVALCLFAIRSGPALCFGR